MSLTIPDTEVVAGNTHMAEATSGSPGLEMDSDVTHSGTVVTDVPPQSGSHADHHHRKTRGKRHHQELTVGSGNTQKLAEDRETKKSRKHRTDDGSRDGSDGAVLEKHCQRDASRKHGLKRKVEKKNINVKNQEFDILTESSDEDKTVEDSTKEDTHLQHSPDNMCEDLRETKMEAKNLVSSIELALFSMFD